MIAMLLLLAVLGGDASSASAGITGPVYAVNSTADVADFNPGDAVCETAMGNGVCTLRAAIQEANANGSAEIGLPAGTFVLSIAGRLEDASATGDLDITGTAVDIVGAGAALSVIDADGIDRAIHVLSGGGADLRDLTLQGGVVTDACPACAGGCVQVESGSLYMQDVLVTDCRAAFGAGINSSASTTTLVSSTVSLNVAATEGGAFRSHSGADATIIDSTIDHNSSNNACGGVENFSSTMRISGSTINGNDAVGRAGGIENLSTGMLRIENSTFSDNTSGSTGGAVYAQNGLVEFRNVTVTDNDAQSGGGVFIEPTGTLDVANSLIAKNFDDQQALQDCDGTLTSSGYNLIETTSGCTITGDTTGNLTAQDPLLTPLADNGGPTLTHVLMAASPAIDAGDVAGCKDLDDVTLVVDQRGFVRPVDGDGIGGARCDIGAVEVVPEPAAASLALAALATLVGTRPRRRRRS